METQLYSGLLHDVWQALEQVGLAGHEGAEGAMGWITAVSVDGVRLRILLRVTERSCQKGERILGDVGEVIRAIPALAGVEVLSKPYGTAASETPVSFVDPTDIAPGHAACLNKVLAEQPRHGWTVEGIQQRNADSSPTNTEHSATTRVLIRARVDTSGENEPRSSRNRTGAVSMDSFLH